MCGKCIAGALFSSTTYKFHSRMQRTIRKSKIHAPGTADICDIVRYVLYLPRYTESRNHKLQ